MKTLLLKLYTAALVVTSAVTTTVYTAELHAMSSGGFTAAYKVLGSEFAVQTGNSLSTVLGPSMSRSPEAIPNRLVCGGSVNAAIMVDYTLDDLIK